MEIRKPVSTFSEGPEKIDHLTSKGQSWGSDWATLAPKSSIFPLSNLLAPSLCFIQTLSFPLFLSSLFPTPKLPAFSSTTLKKVSCSAHTVHISFSSLMYASPPPGHRSGSHGWEGRTQTPTRKFLPWEAMRTLAPLTRASGPQTLVYTEILRRERAEDICASPS